MIILIAFKLHLSAGLYRYMEVRNVCKCNLKFACKYYVDIL